MHVVLDTNIFVSMLLGGRVGQINDAWVAGKFTLIVSDAILSEYIAVLQRPKLHLNADIITAVLTRVYRKAEFVNPTQVNRIIEADQSDNKFLEAAISGKAAYIVSGDNHLLELSIFEGIEILSASQFIDRLILL